MSGAGNGAAAGAESLRSLEYVVVDVETTGGGASRGDRVTEFAAIRIRGTGEVLEEFTTLVNPERPIPPFITRLTNITDEMVRDAPRFGEIAGEVRRLLEGGVFVAHNVSFDWRFVGHELERATGLGLEGRRLCTVKLARRVVPEVASRSLGSLTEYFGIDNDARHRAFGDARATAAVLLRLLERVEGYEVTSWAELEALLERRRRRRKRTSLPESIDCI
ncbi:MAG TPA: exonuclease domain-containing protein [Longimicrobiales bacterium]